MKKTQEVKSLYRVLEALYPTPFHVTFEIYCPGLDKVQIGE